MSNVWQLLEESYIEEYCKAKEEAQEYTQFSTTEASNREKLDSDINM